MAQNIKTKDVNNLKKRSSNQTRKYRIPEELAEWERLVEVNTKFIHKLRKVKQQLESETSKNLPSSSKKNVASEVVLKTFSKGTNTKHFESFPETNAKPSPAIKLSITTQQMFTTQCSKKSKPLLVSQSATTSKPLRRITKPLVIQKPKIVPAAPVLQKPLQISKPLIIIKPPPTTKHQISKSTMTRKPHFTPIPQMPSPTRKYSTPQITDLMEELKLSTTATPATQIKPRHQLVQSQQNCTRVSTQDTVAKHQNILKKREVGLIADQKRSYEKGKQHGYYDRTYLVYVRKE